MRERYNKESKWYNKESTLRIVFAWATLGAWVTAFIVGTVDPHYNPPLGIQGLALMVAGYLFSVPVVKTIRDRNGNGKAKIGDDD